MIDKCGNIVAVNHVLTVGQTEQIGARGVLVNGIGLGICQTWPGVLDHNVLRPDWGCGVNTIGMNLGSPDNQSHRENAAPKLWSIYQCFFRMAYPW